MATWPPENATIKLSPQNSITWGSQAAPAWAANFTGFPRDGNGLSILSPSADSRIVFVDATLGNDGTAVIYDNTDAPDPYTYTPANPYLTIAAAMSQMRDNFPDWCLLKRGETWAITSKIVPVTGKNDLERFVFTAYGTGARPEVTTGITAAWQGSADSFISLQSIRFYADGKDPNSGTFVGFEVPEITGSEIGVFFYAGDLPDPEIQSILIEDCDISYYRNNISFAGTSGGGNITIRKNKVTRAYSEDGHSQGIFTDLCSVFVEENLADHNGWNIQQLTPLAPQEAQGQATIFNHNMYIANATQSIVRNNITSRASSQGVKMSSNPLGGTNTIVAQDVQALSNFIYAGEIGLGVGGNTNHLDGTRWGNISLSTNVFYAVGSERPTNRALAWYLINEDWEGTETKSNLCIHVVTAGVTDNRWLQAFGYMQNSEISGNRVYGFGEPINDITDIDSANFTNVTITDNSEILTPSLPQLSDWLTLYGYSDWDDFVDTTTEFGSQSLTNYFKNSYGMNL